MPNFTNKTVRIDNIINFAELNNQGWTRIDIPIESAYDLGPTLVQVGNNLAAPFRVRTGSPMGFAAIYVTLNNRTVGNNRKTYYLGAHVFNGAAYHFIHYLHERDPGDTGGITDPE